MGKTIYLIDGNSQCYQAFYAISELTSPQGLPVNALYGFLLTLRKILREKKPDYVAVAFDSSKPTFRHEAYAEYKAHRKPMPDELKQQMPMIREALALHNVAVLSMDGYEADDILATVAKRASGAGIDAFIVTRDKDALQLLTPHVKIYDSKADRVYDEKTLLEEKGISAAQVVDVMALEGDSTDNVPGVPGVGPKTALALMKQFGTLDALLDGLEAVEREKLRNLLRDNTEKARLSRQLVELDTNVPVDFKIEDLAARPPDQERLYRFYRELGFKSLLSELEPGGQRSEAAYYLVSTMGDFEDFVTRLSGQSQFVLDTETTSPDPVSARLVGMSFAWSDKEAWYLPLRAPSGQPVLDEAAVIRRLRPILEDPKVSKIGQNIKYDMIVLAGHGIELQGIGYDTMIASYLLNPDARSHGLDDLALEYLNYRKTPTHALLGKGKAAVNMDQVDVDRVKDYACEDAEITYRVMQATLPRLRETDLEQLFRDVELPLIRVLASMERAGVRVDTELLSRISGETAGQIKQVQQRIYEVAGREFNINSPKQLSEVLFADGGRKPSRRTRTGYSTAAGVLEELAPQNDLARLILEYRHLQKLKSTYIDLLPRMVSPTTGLIHASFNQTGTSTGRLSSSDPNLQNIPVRTELGQQIRAAFIPRDPAFVLLTADYSQIDLRMLAHLSGDLALVQAFEADEDIHTSVARQIFGVSSEEVTPDMRRTAKTVNFGIIYGLTPYGLSKQIRTSVEEAAEFIDAYYKQHEGVREFMAQVVQFARDNGYVTTILNRRRYMPTINSPDARTKNLAERMARNAVVQGSAADLIKVAMNSIYDRLLEKHSKTELLLQIHDELVFEVLREAADEEGAMILELMRGALKLRVPLKVNTAVGGNWLEAH